MSFVLAVQVKNTKYVTAKSVKQMAVGEAFVGPIHAIPGIRLAATESAIRYPDRLDLVLVDIAEQANVCGVFTRNAFCAAPVEVSKLHLAECNSRFFLINTGNANAGTGEQGREAALACCDAQAKIAGVPIQKVLPFSTGVIGEPLPTEKILAALPGLNKKLNDTSWEDAAKGIMTTDTRPKLSSRKLEIQGQAVHITGIAKGSGMIRPDMATMLAYVFTDLEIPDSELQSLLNKTVTSSFNRITVDGDTSKNDCCMLVATGKSACSISELPDPERAAFVDQLHDVFQELAIGLIRDAEGASKFVTITVEDGADSQECLQVAYTIAESPLVKTALFASDPNWGRILAAVGRAGIADLAIV